jgi:hypothetical protein
LQHLCAIKGLSEAKVDKILEAVDKIIVSTPFFDLSRGILLNEEAMKYVCVTQESAIDDELIQMLPVARFLGIRCPIYFCTGASYHLLSGN